MKTISLLILLISACNSFAQDCSLCKRQTPINCSVDRDNFVWIEGCRAAVVASWNGMSSTNAVQSCTATVPPSWVLVDTKANVTENNNGSYSVSRYASGTDLEYKKTIDEAYQTALDIAGKIADAKEKKEAELKIKNEYKLHIEWYEKIKTNVDTVIVQVSASSHGSPLDRKRGWMAVDVQLGVMCAAPPNLAEQIKKKNKLDTPDLAQIVDIEFKNSTNEDKFVGWKAVDRFTKCDTQGGTISIAKVPKNNSSLIYADQAVEICYSVLAKTTSVPVFSSSCRTKFGEAVDLFSADNSCKSQ